MKIMQPLSKEEYNCLRGEINERVKYFMSQGISVFTAIIAVWAIFITIFAVMTQLSGFNILVKFFINLMAVALLFSTIIFLLSHSNKVADNLTKISSLAAYLKIFHEIPSLYYNGKDVYLWEIAQNVKESCSGDNENKSKFSLKIASAEYAIMGWISLAFIVVTTIVSAIVYYNESKCVFVLTIFIGCCFFLVGIILLIMIKFLTSTKRNLTDRAKNLNDEYIKLAKDLGLVDEEGINYIHKILTVHDVNN